MNKIDKDGVVIVFCNVCQFPVAGTSCLAGQGKDSRARVSMYCVAAVLDYLLLSSQSKKPTIVPSQVSLFMSFPLSSEKVKDRA